MSVKVVFTLKENKDELSLCTAPPPLPGFVIEGKGWLYTGQVQCPSLFSCFINFGLFHSLFHFQ